MRYRDDFLKWSVLVSFQYIMKKEITNATAQTHKKKKKKRERQKEKRKTVFLN